MHEQMLMYMKAFIKRDEYLLMDSTHIFSNSSLITLSRKGYSSRMTFDPSFNLFYIYSAKHKYRCITVYCQVTYAK